MLPIFPGTDFDSVIELYGKGNALNLPALVYFDFRDAPIGVWGGGYDLTAGGMVWQGLGKSGLLIGIDGLEDNTNLQASDMTFSISGVDDAMMAIFKDEDRAGYVGSMVGVYAQFCDVSWQPVTGCPPLAIRAGFMGAATASRTQNEDGSWTRTLSLPASNMFYGRGNAPASFFTDRDQQIRHPGDRFFQFVPSIQEASINVPWR